MNRFLSIFFSFFLCLSIVSQTKEEAIRDAKKTAKATLASDFKTVLDFTYPPVVNLMGGKEKALATIISSMEEMEKSGFKFEKADVISASDIVKEQNQYRCFIKNNYVMLLNGQKITSEAYLLGIYNDADKVWNFIEAKQLGNPAISKVLPNFKTALIIPQGKMLTEKI
ncbi:MAG: hypothetical protein ACPGTO_00855 [Polaribacter sp.]